MDVFLANEQGVPLDEPQLAALARHVLEAENVDPAFSAFACATWGHTTTSPRSTDSSSSSIIGNASTSVA